MKTIDFWQEWQEKFQEHISLAEDLLSNIEDFSGYEDEWQECAFDYYIYLRQDHFEDDQEEYEEKIKEIPGNQVQKKKIEMLIQIFQTKSEELDKKYAEKMEEVLPIPKLE